MNELRQRLRSSMPQAPKQEIQSDTRPASDKTTGLNPVVARAAGAQALELSTADKASSKQVPNPAQKAAPPSPVPSSQVSRKSRESHWASHKIPSLMSPKVNNYSRPGGNQNLGNRITGRPSSRVLAPPGGQSNLSFF